MTTLTKSSYVILGLLSKSNLSGYALKRILTKTSAFYGSESNAQIYPVLKKLESQGLVRSALDKASGARNKRVFTLTPKGLEALMHWLKQDCTLEVPREDFLMHLSLAQHLTPTELMRKITHYQSSIADKIKELHEIRAHLQQQHTGKKDQRYLLLTYEHIETVLNAKLKWCDKILQQL